MTPDTLPLTAAETAKVEGLLVARTRLARMFSWLAVLPTLAFLLRMYARAYRLGRPADMLEVASGLGVVALVGWVAWYFGWRLVRDMRADLAGGQKQLVRGEITAVDCQKNAYGETITHLTVGSTKYVSRTEAMGNWKRGQRARLACLPRSKVVFGGELEGPAG